jgi:hypothetical protein
MKFGKPFIFQLVFLLALSSKLLSDASSSASNLCSDIAKVYVPGSILVGGSILFENFLCDVDSERIDQQTLDDKRSVARRTLMRERDFVIQSEVCTVA